MVRVFAILEVLDKLPNAGQLWGTALMSGAVGFLVCRQWPRPAVATPVLLVAAFLAWGKVAILTDAHVGPAAAEERGTPYVASILGAAMVTLLLPILGLYARRGRVSNRGHN